MKNLAFRAIKKLTVTLILGTALILGTVSSGQAAIVTIPFLILTNPSSPALTTMDYTFDYTLPPGAGYQEFLTFTLTGFSATTTPTVTTQLEGSSPTVTFSLSPGTITTTGLTPYTDVMESVGSPTPVPVAGSFDELIVSLTGSIAMGDELIVSGVFDTIPEPSVTAMLLCGLGALALVVRRRRRSSL